MDDRLRPLWDFDDLDGSEQRLREQLERETSNIGRAEVLTQLARVQGLRGSFDEGETALREAESLAGASRLANARIDLERGRLRRSSGDVPAALPLFESAFDTGLDAGAAFVAADAAHMAALASPGREGFVGWTKRGIEVAEEHEGASYWVGPLLNNLGWEYHDAGDFELALDAFERALAARERDGSSAQAIEIARYAVGKTLRALGQAEEAIPLLEQAVAWTEKEASPDGWFHEELAEEYAAVGRDDDARAQAARAIPLLERDDPSFSEDADRAGRLGELLSRDSPPR